MGQKGHIMDQKGLKIYEKKRVFDQNTCFLRNFFQRNFGDPSPLNRNLFAKQNQRHWGLPSASGKIRTLLKSSRKLAVIWKNPDSFEIIREIGSHLENPDSKIIRKIGNHPENPDNFEIIRKIGSQLENPDSFEIIRKIGIHLEKSGQF